MSLPNESPGTLKSLAEQHLHQQPTTHPPLHPAEVPCEGEQEGVREAALWVTLAMIIRLPPCPFVDSISTRDSADPSQSQQSV